MLPQDDPTKRLLTEANAATRYADASINRKSSSFDFTAAAPTYHATLNLAETSVMQAFVINEKTNEIYTSQVSNGEPDTSESITFTRMTIDGVFIDSMKLRHGGHGTTFGVENDTDGVYIWSNIDQVNGSGETTGTELCRVKWSGGAVYSETSPELTRYPKYTTAYMTPVIDQKNGTIGFRTPSTSTVQLRSIADVKASNNVILNTITVPADIAGCAGASIDGDDLYWYTGDVNSTTYPNEITRISFTTGQIEKRTTVDYGRGPDGTYEYNFREPEGLYLYTNPATGDKTLFGGVVTGQTGKRRNKVYGFHSLGNESFFIGNKTQRMQSFKLTEGNGRAFRLVNTTSLASYLTPGTWYITTAESSGLTDHPLPNVAGWYFEVSAADSSGGVYQTLRRASSIPGNLRIYYRTVASNGTSSPWITLNTGTPTWAAITPTSLVASGSPVASLASGGVKVEMQGMVKLIAETTYTAGMVIGTMPVGMWPSTTRRLAAPVDDLAGGRTLVTFQSDGTVKLYAPTPIDKNIILDGLQFHI